MDYQMSDFQLSPELDRNKVFLVQRSGLEGRLDPHFYKPEFLVIVDKLYNLKARTLKSVNIIIRKGIFDLSPDNYCKKGIPFLRVSDIKDGTINFNNTTFITHEKHETELYTEYFPGDLVISKVGTIGEVSILPSTYKKYNISQNVVGLRLDDETRKTLSPSFLQICLQTSFGIQQLYRQATTGVQPKITLDAIRSILIPIPPKEIQSQIVAKMDAAYAAKKQKETEAQRLLDSIDDYLLGELGIELPEQENNTIESRMFTRRLSEVSGGRFDPDYHLQFYKKIEKAIHKSGYNIKKIADIATKIFQGVGREITCYDKCTLLKVKNILKDNEIDFLNVEYVHSNNKNKYLEKGDVLTPFIGEAIKQYKFVVFPNKSNIYTVDNNTGVIRLRKNIDPCFVAAYLMSSLGKWQIDKLTGGGGVPFIGTFNAKKLKIIVPPLEKQTEIANHITIIRNQAKALQQQAKTDLEQAKKEVEAMILGEDEN